MKVISWNLLRLEGAAVEDVAALLERERPDVLLLDVMLPDGDGLALTAEVRQTPRLQGLPILMLTARSEERDKIQGLDAGADDYITKPFSTQELLARIRAVFRRRTTSGFESHFFGDAFAAAMPKFD